MRGHGPSAGSTQAPGDAEPLQQVRRVAMRVLVLIAFFSVFVNLLVLAVPLYMLQLFDRVLATRNVDTLIVLTLIAVFAIAVLAALEIVRGRITARLGAWVEQRLAGEALAGALAIAQHRRGQPSAQSLRDLAQLRLYLSSNSVFPLLDAPWVPVFLLVVFMMHPTLGWIATVGAVILGLIALLNEVLTRRPVQQSNEAGARTLNSADAVVRNADSVAAMGMLPALTRAAFAKTADGQHQHLSAADRSGALMGAARFIRLGLQIGVLGTGAYLVTLAEITGGVMIAASIIMGRALAPIEQLIPAWRALISTQTSFRRLQSTLALAPPRAGTTRLDRPKGQLSVERMSYFEPSNRAPILRGIAFGVRAGEALGVIGPSGAGKSTLARLIVGSLTPSDGSARLDGADVAQWAAADRGQYVGYLPQDIELFDGTVRENIARFQDASDDQVLAAARLSGAYELIAELPQAFDTVIGSEGVPLSGGQRQRVALARAVFGKPSLVVLDEPNSNLDGDGERALVETIDRLKAAGATVVLIAQRPSILQQMDKLLVLRAGLVETFGPRDEVLASIGRPQPIAASGRTPDIPVSPDAQAGVAP